MKELAALVLTFVSVVSYFLLATGVGLYQRWPLVHIAVCFAACAWLVLLLVKSTGWGRRLYGATLLLVSLALALGFTWYTLDYSTYETHEASVAPGEDLSEPLAQLRLASHTGELSAPVRLGQDRGTLLVFYRGHW